MRIRLHPGRLAQALLLPGVGFLRRDRPVAGALFCAGFFACVANANYHAAFYVEQQSVFWSLRLLAGAWVAMLLATGFGGCCAGAPSKNAFLRQWAMNLFVPGATFLRRRRWFAFAGCLAFGWSYFYWMVFQRRLLDFTWYVGLALLLAWRADRSRARDRAASRAAALAIVSAIYINLLAFGLGHFIYVSRLSGASDEPTIRDGAGIVISPAYFRFRTPVVGQFVLVEQDRQMLVKRIIAISPQMLIAHEGWIFSSESGDRPLASVRPGDQFPTSEWGELGPNQVFVAGANDRESYDSRNFGPVPLHSLRGRVVGQIPAWADRP